jgi:AraC-like DNA-binding protein
MDSTEDLLGAIFDEETYNPTSSMHVAGSASSPASSAQREELPANLRYQRFQMLVPILEHLIQGVIRELRHLDDISEIASEGLSQEFLWALIQGSQGSGSTRAARITKRASELIRSRFSNRCLIANLAEELGIHRSQLSRWFKASYGITLSDFVRICRIDKSLDLLTDDEMTIAKIALDCGFNDQSHFTRSFREVMTTTPAKWRKAIANNESL